MSERTADLQELLSRVEKAEGPDRELDREICLAARENVSTDPLSGFVWRPNGGGGWSDVPDLTASLDAALALVERVLPGSYVELSGPRKYLHIPTPVPNRWKAYIATFNHDGDKTGWAATPALALLAALLRALMSTHSEEGAG
jgi:hypothetical protein